MLHIRITVYKPSGKYYTDKTVQQKEDIKIFSENFKALVRGNLPARLGEGFVVVCDMEDGAGFHNVLYRAEELL